MILYLLSGTMAVHVQGNDVRQILFDFESEESLKGWHADEGAQMDISSTWSADGRQSMHVIFDVESKNAWPLVAMNEKMDVSAGNRLQFDVYNPRKTRAVFSIKIEDGREKSEFKQTFLLPGGIQRRISVPLDIPSFANREILDRSAITGITFYISKQKTDDDVELYIDTMSVGDSTQLRLADYAQRLQDVSRKLSAADMDQLQQYPELYALWDSRAGILKAITRLQALCLEGALAENNVIDTIEQQVLCCESLPELFRMAQQGEQPVAIRTAGPMTQIHLHTTRTLQGLSKKKYLTYQLARNEYESGQVIIIPTSIALNDVQWSLQTPVNEDGQALDTTVRVVGYVDCQQPPYVVPFSGWWPDPLLSGIDAIKQVPLGEVLSLWVTVHADANTKAGIYRGRLAVTSGEKTLCQTGLEVDVWDFTIPTRCSIPTISTVQHNKKHLTAVYGPKRSQWALATFEDFALKYRITPTDMYRNPTPTWNEAWLKRMIDGGANVFVLGQFGHHAITEDNIDQYHIRRSKEFPVWRKNHRLLRSLGWNGPIVICGYDEAAPEMSPWIVKSYEFLQKHLPADVIFLPVGTLDVKYGVDWPEGLRPDQWVVILPKFDSESKAIDVFRAHGGKPWLYTCLSAPHPYPMVYVEYGSSESRLLAGAFSWKYDVSGWLYYHLCRWPNAESPMNLIDGRRTDWNPVSFHGHNGSGSLIYGGPTGPVATIRLENLRDGFEDYEYYRLANEKTLAAGLHRIIVSPEVVENTRNWTRSGQSVQAERNRLARIILANDDEK